MSTDTLGYPAHLRDTLRYKLPGRPVVHVYPRDEDHRRCPVYAADHYEVTAFYTAVGDDHDRAALEQALRELPGTYLTTQLRGNFPAPGVTVSNPGWPVRYPRGSSLRVQVRALLRDPGASS